MIIFRNIPRGKCLSCSEQLLYEDSLVLELAAMESKVWVDGAVVVAAATMPSGAAGINIIASPSYGPSTCMLIASSWQ